MQSRRTPSPSDGVIDSSVMLKPLVIGAELGRRTVRGASRLPGVNIVMARGIVASGRLAQVPPETRISGELPAVATFQERAAKILFAANERGAWRLLESLDVDAVQDPEALERLAVRYFKLRCYAPALAMRRRAAALEPGDPYRWTALAQSLQKADDGGVVHDTVAGLVCGPVSATEEARGALRRAEQLDPENPHILQERGKLEFSHGDSAEGLELMARAARSKPRSRWWMDLGAAYRAPHVADYDRSLDAYEEALRLKPTSPTAFRGVIIMGCRAGHDWPRLWEAARLYESSRRRSPAARLDLMDRLSTLFTAEPVEEEVDAAIAALDRAHASGRRLSWPTTSLIVYRLQFLQRMHTGFALRRRLAERTLSWLGTASAGHSRHRQKVLSALVYLGRHQEAQRLIDPMPWEPTDRVERHRLEKMAADVHLIGGRARPLIEYAERRREDTPLPGEASMEELIRGQRVAVVGPADTGDRFGEEIDAHDVIIRPRFMAEFDAEQAERLGTRTDVAYFSGRDIGEFVEEAGAAVDAGRLKMAVGRGLSMEAFEGEMPEWLRFYRHDFSLGFHGPPMGIGRILYDLLQFGPAEVGLYNIDFFSGQTAFSKGYRPARDQGLGPYSIVNEIILAHDLVFEHRMTRAVEATGVLRARGVAGEVLALSEEEYISRLESSPALQTSRSPA